MSNALSNISVRWIWRWRWSERGGYSGDPDLLAVKELKAIREKQSKT